MKTATDLSTVNGVGSAADQAHRVVDRAKEKAAPAAERAAEAAHRTIDNVAKAAAPAARWASENSDHLATRSTQFVELCSDQVRARPLVAVAAALAVGYLVGKLNQR
jgi:ElaB/YqjD/DUF883 family membrane-anchored ribosome-binding protein